MSDSGYVAVTATSQKFCWRRASPSGNQLQSDMHDDSCLIL